MTIPNHPMTGNILLTSSVKGKKLRRNAIPHEDGVVHPVPRGIAYRYSASHRVHDGQARRKGHEVRGDRCHRPECRVNLLNKQQHGQVGVCHVLHTEQQCDGQHKENNSKDRTDEVSDLLHVKHARSRTSRAMMTELPHKGRPNCWLRLLPAPAIMTKPRQNCDPVRV